ncbi:HU family DNA-binding protein [Emcibacter nanhaiensis]|uniref:HU family DNA-binding protein n=1 Tax=Emcibacter nanhaiensis TaxID=1505037 RepID=A0A501PQS0_9PROT|nr:HU family DNA-binding protein [Emcibacter nanhaiensis]TPD62879.1 HU family DNA-binding protein [Emcibacter nanhaiensis]
MNKNDLIASVATAADISKADAAQAVDGVFNAITAALSSGDEVRLVGFGTFSVAARAASEGRNPRTGEKIQIPASKQPKFKAGKALKDAVNK